MSILASYRLASAIENGTYTSGTLTTALGTAKTAVEFQGIVSSRELLKRVMSNADAVPIILDSTAASALLYKGNAKLLLEVLPECYEFMKAVVATTARFYAFSAIGGVTDAIQKSTNALYCINYFAVDAVYKTIPVHFVRVKGDGSSFVAAMADSALYKTTIAVTSTGVLVKRANQAGFTKVAVGGGDFIPKDVASDSTGGTVVVVGATGIYYSTDGGFNWSKGTTPSAAQNRVIYGGTLFVCAGVGTIYTSSDGITWTSRTAQAACTYNDILYAGGTTYFAVGAHSTASSAIQKSTNGTTWTTSGTSNALTGIIGIVMYSATTFFVYGGSSTICKTTNTGGSWSSVLTGTLGTGSNSAVSMAVTSSGNIVLTVDDTSAGEIIGSFSTDSSTWLAVTTPQVVGSAKAIAAAGRGMVWYLTDKTEIGVAIGSESSSSITTFYNYDGSVILPYVDASNTVTGPFILSSGVYIPGADGSIYCSNIAR